MKYFILMKNVLSSKLKSLKPAPKPYGRLVPGASRKSKER